MLISYIWLGFAICLGVAGQVVLKRGSHGAATTLDQLLSPWTIFGLGIYFIAAVSYILALKRIPVSLAYPSVSISYGILAILAHILWHEPLTWQHGAGIALISTGIYVLFRA